MGLSQMIQAALPSLISLLIISLSVHPSRVLRNHVSCLAPPWTLFPFPVSLLVSVFNFLYMIIIFEICLPHSKPQLFRGPLLPLTGMTEIPFCLLSPPCSHPMYSPLRSHSELLEAWIVLQTLGLCSSNSCSQSEIHQALQPLSCKSSGASSSYQTRRRAAVHSCVLPVAGSLLQQFLPLFPRLPAAFCSRWQEGDNYLFMVSISLLVLSFISCVTVGKLLGSSVSVSSSVVRNCRKWSGYIITWQQSRVKNSGS